MRKLKKAIKGHIFGSVYLYSASFQMDLHSDLSLICLVPKSKLFPQHQSDTVSESWRHNRQPARERQPEQRQSPSVGRLLFVEHHPPGPSTSPGILVDTDIYSTPVLFTQPLLHARSCSRLWRYSSEHTRQKLLPSGACSQVGR